MHISELPQDTLTWTVAFMDLSSFIMFVRTCKTMFTLHEIPIVWRILFDNELSCVQRSLEIKIAENNSYLPAYNKIKKTRTKYNSNSTHITKELLRRLVSKKYLHKYTKKVRLSLTCSTSEQEIESILHQVEHTISVHVPKDKQEQLKRKYIRHILRSLRVIINEHSTSNVTHRLMTRIFVHNKVTVPAYWLEFCMKNQTLTFIMKDLKNRITIDQDVLPALYANNSSLNVLVPIIENGFVSPSELQQQLITATIGTRVYFYFIKDVEGYIGRLNLVETNILPNCLHLLNSRHSERAEEAIEWMVSSPGMDHQSMAYILQEYTRNVNKHWHKEGVSVFYKKEMKPILTRKDFGEIWKFIKVDEMLVDKYLVELFIEDMNLTVGDIHELMIKILRRNGSAAVLAKLGKYCKNLRETVTREYEGDTVLSLVKQKKVYDYELWLCKNGIMEYQ